MRFRQVHLDFHTSEAIEGIGSEFDKTQWQQALKTGHVDLINCFSKCHHGWSYHATKVGKRHPHLAFDLLTEQISACKEIGVNVQIYISAGVDGVASYEHPEWREVGANGQYTGWAREITTAGFHKMCFNSPYLDYLCEQIREAVAMYPQADGVWLDIIFQYQCCCKWCLAVMDEHALDPTIEADRLKCARIGLDRYYRLSTAACRCLRADMPVFHNSGHVQRGRRDILGYFSHLELESLPTGGWGYDYFPIQAKYCKNLPLDFVGMTGKFHTTWGEFGGYKHPNALRYECAAMLAYGAKCSVGDQLHPRGKMDPSTYELIGAAYAEVEAKEPWCRDVENIADFGLLSAAAVNADEARDVPADTGAARILLEGHLLFDVLDAEMDFSKYKVIILPDEVRIDGPLARKLNAYLAGGGKLFLTGESGLAVDGAGFIFDIGASYHGRSQYLPDYVLPGESFRPTFVNSPMVMYLSSQRIKATTGRSLGAVYDPYFNRSFRHFCSHQHAPARPEPSGFDCGVHNGNVMYLAHPVFKIYRAMGAVAHRQYVVNALRSLLGEPTVATNLPSTARLSMMRQEKHRRDVLHLLYANTISRGGEIEMGAGTFTGKGWLVEVIEELLPLRNINLQVRPGKTVCKVTLEPQGRQIDFKCSNGTTELTIEEFACHQMVVLHYSA
ncbi:MAG: beta-galactosidase trimerization domain-containing protein [Planctomycetes bacterium]|nr:beta-galactosidase trimerization domain-containing protein [Planctomycetota bacterium]